MASVRERVAALNLAEKLCVRPAAYGVVSKPAQSPSFWSGLISHLRSAVKVEHRRVLFKSHSDCFLGSEAVDVLADHITHVKGLEGADISRRAVLSMCQVLLDCQVFEAVGTKVFGKIKKQNVFQDSKSALYRFLNTHTPSVDELERGVLTHGLQKLLSGVPSDRSTQMGITAKANQLEALGNISQSSETLVESLSPSRLKTDSTLPQSLVDEVWQQQTLLRLLKLVELPLLDGVLQCSQASSSSSSSPSPPHNNPDLIYSSNHLDRQILKVFRDSQEDEWLCAALDCLDFLPDQPVVEMSRELPHFFPEDQSSCDHMTTGHGAQDGGRGGGDHPGLLPSSLAQCKMLLYRTLATHYSQSDRAPLLPQHMTDVYTAITDMLVNGKPDKALEALQLCLKLLPPSCREELHRLLTFVALAANPHGIKLDKEMENRWAVKKSFSRAILHSRTLSKEKEDLMMVFMLSNTQELFKIPGALHKAVSDVLASVVDKSHRDVPGLTFCQQVSSGTLAGFSKTTTNQELRALLQSIHLDPKISAKQRKRLLGQFYQAHPEIFHQYWGDSAVSVL
ncbi:DEP domain-containing protein 7-like isoform X2 [Myripristis murdjan]|uniref:DEP domain-containing protein 7-like isoform X2 n=1 Tax=Myripristis murdjan TaxID=586833 RepID=UPI001175F2A4|nr:DEP domain-containing protein 7-like isoform X2 [Myripristis murdjan]